MENRIFEFNTMPKFTMSYRSGQVPAIFHWANPLSDIMDGWGLTNTKGEFSTGSIENFICSICSIIALSIQR